MAYSNNTFASDDPSITSYYDYRSAEEYATYLLPHIKPNFHILDVGCGPGSITRDLAKLVPEGKVTGTDMSPGVVEQASAAYKAANLSFQAANATDLSQFEDNSFDIVHGHCVIMHVPDQVKALKEMARVVKPGGIVASRDPGAGLVGIKPDREPFTRLVHEYALVEFKFLEKIGSCGDAGLRKREWAAQAGWTEENGGRIWEQKSYERAKRSINLCKGPLRDKVVGLGIATGDQVDGWTDIWNQWETLEERESVREFVDMLYFKP